MQQLAAELVRRAADEPDAVAVIDDAGVHTVAEIVEHAGELAEVFDRELGGSPTVLVQADNSWRTLAAAVAVGLRGGFLAVFSRQAAASEFRFALDDVAPDIVVADDPVFRQWTSDGAHERFPRRARALGDWVVASADGPPGDVTRWRGGSLAAQTSGSTGRPKCVVHSESSLTYAGSCTIDAVGLRLGDRVAALVPLSSVAAACFGMYLPARNGFPMVCLNKWSPDVALELLREHEVAWTMLVPTMALQLSIQDGAEGALRSLRAMTVGGGPMDAGALERAERTLGTTILRVFGMSECLGHTTPHPSDPPEIRLGRDGRPFPGTTVRAVDDEGRVCAPGEVGAGQVKGPSLFLGYARDGAPTPPELTDDGFLPTGDLLEVGADGTVMVRGRQKQMIIRGGRNIDINEVEAAVARMPQASQVCVVPVPDELLGERVAALVVSEAGGLGLADVTEFLASTGFPKNKWPEFVFSVPELPLNRVGKLSRADAIALATQLAREKQT
ncbi:class I adenylate-forming enzyme family protein [Mycolicibacterium thermoresistibile]|uniref:Synthetase n=2 Tax=Mycolicibacterium thermoresistibile TaxID=1797 RepID=G7CJB2_MYCT3|nr:class I adenylate-forming enzyme family protein [Mycolicibacterium thermoresistibile]EHI12710.1 synthetase [Mycolicibacterium thermoresistibile ATCC 19527]MCV7190029.1 acyl--CoA ligase [Mycolicibacterium thermoresistibile]GAT13914.1 synthetase [Mycolicibacterium thermoresistibile]SNW19087.1 acyl-CoA synthetase (AMP-forming)/AMP-acid ligase II [Mycolicibacterium thermoresistibile]